VYLVWSRNIWVTIVPAMMTATMLAGGIGTTWSFGRFSATTIFETQTKKFLTTAFSATLSMNVLCTFLIAYRVWSNAKRLRPYVHGRIYSVPVLEIVVESAAILCCCIIATMVAYIIGSNVQFTGVSITVPTIGISWTLIIVRVGLGYASVASRSGTGAAGSAQPQGIALTSVPPVAIRVSRHTESDYNAIRSPYPSPMKSEFMIPSSPRLHAHDEYAVNRGANDTKIDFGSDQSA